MFALDGSFSMHDAIELGASAGTIYGLALLLPMMFPQVATWDMPLTTTVIGLTGITIYKTLVRPYVVQQMLANGSSN